MDDLSERRTDVNEERIEDCDRKTLAQNNFSLVVHSRSPFSPLYNNILDAICLLHFVFYLCYRYHKRSLARNDDESSRKLGKWTKVA